ncbi:MAG TPA: hypothetical protein PLY97_04900 [Acidocella sp.]|nr:hypothetical protein [Acidocella sp.]
MERRDQAGVGTGSADLRAIAGGGLGAEGAGWFLYLLPVVSAGGGYVVLGEQLSGMAFLGGGLIMASVLLSQKAK